MKYVATAFYYILSTIAHWYNYNSELHKQYSWQITNKWRPHDALYLGIIYVSLLFFVMCVYNRYIHRSTVHVICLYMRIQVLNTSDLCTSPNSYTVKKSSVLWNCPCFILCLQITLYFYNYWHIILCWHVQSRRNYKITSFDKIFV